MPTTEAAIRDHMISLITALVPTVNQEDRFRVYQNEREGDFLSFAQASGPGSFRRFQVRDTGTGGPPLVTNTDVELVEVTFDVLVAYPHNHRTGPQNALDRDDAIRADQALIENTVGLRGYENFNGIDGPAASWFDGSVARIPAQGLDLLMIRQQMRFWRAT